MKIQVSLQFDWNNGYFTRRPGTVHLRQHLAEFFIRRGMFRTNIVQKIKTHILCSILSRHSSPLQDKC